MSNDVFPVNPILDVLSEWPPNFGGFLGENALQNLESNYSVKYDLYDEHDAKIGVVGGIDGERMLHILDGGVRVC